MVKLTISQTKINRHPTLRTFLETDSPATWRALDWRSELNKTYTDFGEMVICLYDLNLVSICAALGKLNQLAFLAANAPQRTVERLRENDYFPYYHAAANGQFDVLVCLEAIAPSEVNAMLSADEYAAYREAAANNQLDVMRHMEQKAPENLLEMIGAGKYEAYRSAAVNGHLTVLQHLERQAPQRIMAMVSANEYEAYRAAASKGLDAVLLHLERIAPSLLSTMVRAKEYEAYRRAAAKGHLHTLLHLERLVPSHVSQMLKANNFAAYLAAVRGRHTEVIYHLLNHGCVFAYAETHETEQDAPYFRHYVTQQLTLLQAQKCAFEQHYPTGVFDISVNQLPHYFYILRHLVSHPQSPSLRQIGSLFLLPTIHNALTNNDNELLRLALRAGNRDAVNTLLLMPTVRTLAKKHQFYQKESHLHSQLNLKSLYHNPEPMMLTLTQEESKIIARIRSHYKDQMHALGGVNAVFNDFKKSLARRYQKKPATIQLEEATILLPLSWIDFQQLKITFRLTNQQYQQALKSYYQHPVHTAWRYLLKPNPWMHHDAAYVYFNPTTKAQWSTFETYISTIAYLWLAASDSHMPATEGYTLKSRTTLFIQRIALIGRAHNLDNTREIPPTNGQHQDEEHDDLEGDKPACFSGVNQGLLKAVLGHPFFECLTPERLRQEIHHYVWEHFKSLLAPLSSAEHTAILAAINRCLIRENSRDDLTYLARFNLTEEQSRSFKSMLEEKYGQELREAPLLQQQFHQMMALDSVRKTHFESFYHCFKLYTLLKTDIRTTLHKRGFFNKVSVHPELSAPENKRCVACHIL